MNVRLLILLFLTSFPIFAIELKIENDPVFKALISEFNDPGKNVVLYQESLNYRFDLTLSDIVDRVENLTNKRFSEYDQELKGTLNKDPLNFGKWFLKLKDIASSDDKFYNTLNRKLFVQLYNKDSVALLPEYKYIDFKKLTQLGLLRRITRYNEFLSLPEKNGLLAAFSRITPEKYSLQALTVAKMEGLKNKFFRKLKKSYYKVYLPLINLQYKIDNVEGNYKPMFFVWTNKRIIVPRERGVEGKKYYFFTHGKDIFNAIFRSSEKHKVLKYLNDYLSEYEINIPVRNGFYVPTPIFFQKNLELVREALREYTLEKAVDPQDDEYLWQFRTWVKRNSADINAKAKASGVDIVIEDGKRPKRFKAMALHPIVEKLFPSRPWLSKDQPHFHNRKGKKLYFESRTLGKRLGSLIKSVTKVENIAGVLAGTGVMILSGGNYAFAMSASSVVKNGVYSIKHNRELKEFLKSAPSEVINAIMLGAGFSPGRLYKIIALGAAQGGIQSFLTGQDIRTGAVVGAGFNLLSYYVLPYALNKPMTSGFDDASLRTNAYLEIFEKTLKRSAQGALVAALTGENVLAGAGFGALYGSISTVVKIWFLGTRYHPFKDYSPEEVDEMIAHENEFQNEYGRGEYDIDRQLFLDADFRTGGILPDAISASITLPGSVSMGDNGFESLFTLTHEASHLMQQHQSGVFGFYLFRYIPTALKYGYDAHPDEQNIRDVISHFVLD